MSATAPAAARGADRLFGGDIGDASAVIPTVRIVNVGFAFD